MPQDPSSRPPPPLFRDPVNPYSLWPEGYDPREHPIMPKVPSHLAARNWYSFTHWPSDRRGRIWAAVTASTAVVVACTCLCSGIALLASQPDGSAQAPAPAPSATQATYSLAPTSTSVGPAVSRTPTPVPTPTAPAPQPLDGATLGGNRFHFDDLYGYPTSGGGTMSPTWDTVLPTGQELELHVAVQTGRDGQPHVVLVTFGPWPGDPGWDAGTAATAAAAFLPPDARPRATVTTAHGDLDHIYTSARLGATLPAEDFKTDDGSRAVPVGTFDWLCLHDAPDGGIDQCMMAPGQAQ